MDIEALRARFTSCNRELKLDTYNYLLDPRQMHTMKDLTYYGDRAKRSIAEYQTLIETMEAYQKLLYERAQAITVAPYHHEIHLTRQKRYQGNVTYCLELLKVYDTPGISPETLERTTYPGTERHKAIAAFEDYRKSHAGIIAAKDIAKGKWER